MRRSLALATFLCVAVAFLAAGASGSSADPTVVTVENLDLRGPEQTLERPRRFELRSGNLSVVFLGLTWRHWGAPRSVGSGMVRTCGSSSGCRTRATVLRAGSRQRCGGEYFYDRLTVSDVPMLGAGPVELPVETIPCASPGSG